jgi:hypothetical protein
MKWFDQWMYKQAKKAWENKDQYEEVYSKGNRMGTLSVAQIERGRAEGEDRITFELTTAIGGRILNVRRYDDRKDRHDQQTYIIPNGEDLGQRVAKILNLEQYK